jgi:hypothetical protein
MTTSRRFADFGRSIGSRGYLWAHGSSHGPRRLAREGVDAGPQRQIPIVAGLRAIDPPVPVPNHVPQNRIGNGLRVAVPRVLRPESREHLRLVASAGPL